MKILQLGKFHPILGGVEKVMYTFMLELSKHNINCDMLCAAVDKAEEIELSQCSRLIKTKALIKTNGTMISPRMVVKLREIAQEYDVIHIHHPDPMATLALFLSGYSGKVILHWHSDILKQKVLLKFYQPLQSWLIKRSDLILGTTPVYIEETPFLQKVKSKLDYLPIGVEANQSDEAKVAEIKAMYPNKKIVYSMGRFVEYKGFEYLALAAKYLPSDYLILIGGRGVEQAKVEALIEREGLSDKVKLLGFIPEGMEANYYAASDVFCLSSIMKTEAYAIVQVEAMSLGKPIVATNITGSGVSWVNKHKESGLNVSVKNPQEIAEAILEITSDDKKYKGYCTRAKKRYEELFTIEKMTDRLIQIYESIIR